MTSSLMKKRKSHYVILKHIMMSSGSSSLDRDCYFSIKALNLKVQSPRVMCSRRLPPIYFDADKKRIVMIVRVLLHVT